MLNFVFTCVHNFLPEPHPGSGESSSTLIEIHIQIRTLARCSMSFPSIIRTVVIQLLPHELPPPRREMKAKELSTTERGKPHIFYPTKAPCRKHSRNLRTPSSASSSCPGTKVFGLEEIIIAYCQDDGDDHRP